MKVALFLATLAVLGEAKRNKGKNRTKRQNRRPSRQRIPAFGVEEVDDANDLFYSPQFIEKLEAKGIDTTEFMKANKTLEDQMVSIIIMNL